MLDCRDVSRYVAESGSRSIGFVRRAEIALHLMVCRHCRRYESQIRALMRAAKVVLKVDPAPDPDDRLRRRIVEEATAWRGVAGTDSSSDPSEPPDAAA